MARTGRRRFGRRQRALALGIMLLVACATACVPPVPTGPTRGAPGVGDPYLPLAGDGGYDVAHYGLRIRYDPTRHFIRGVATIDARTTQRLSQFDLDLVGLTVRNVVVQNESARYVRLGQELVITPRRPLVRNQLFRVVVRYDGVPQLIQPDGGVFFTADGFAVAGQPRGAATWFPANDHPLDVATFTYRVTVPNGLGVVANGLPVRDFAAGNGWTTHVWATRSPLATYLATVDVGIWGIRLRAGPHRLPIIDAVDPKVGTEADDALGKEPEMISFLEHFFGPYPFESAGTTVDDFATGFALETQTRPVIPRLFFILDNGENVVVHELAHQWTGDSVRLARWRDIWLNEGFATYVEWLWTEHTGGATPEQIFSVNYAGQDAAFWKLNIGNPGLDHMFDQEVYTRGGMTLEALRLTIGDDAFFRVVRRWTTRNAGKAVTTPDFVRLAERISGRDLRAFFHAWLSSPTRPPLPAMSAAPQTFAPPLANLGGRATERPGM